MSVFLPVDLQLQLLFCLASNAVPLVADPKRSDLSSLSRFMPNGQVASDTGSISLLLDTAFNETRARYEFMERGRTGMLQIDYAYFGLSEVVFVMNEQAAFLAMLSKKEREDYERRQKANLMQSRQVGCLFMSAMVAGQCAELVRTEIPRRRGS